MNQNIENIIKKLLSEINGTLVVVTKNQSYETIKKLLEIDNVTDIGESRMQEFKERFLQTTEGSNSLYNQCTEKGVKLHFIGHLQTNKVKEAVKYFDMIQSVDNFKILKKINDEAAKTGKVQHVLFEVNICADQNKYGFSQTEIIEIQTKIEQFKNIKAEGLMTILAQGINENEQFKRFKELKDLTNKLGLHTISMGMSQDYKIAIAAGSNMIRIGNLIFT